MTTSPTSRPQVLGYRGPAGDHNDRPNRSVPPLLEAVTQATGRPGRLFGVGFEARTLSSGEHLAAARPHLAEYAGAVGAQLAAGHRPVCVHGRCAVSLATLPRVMEAHPDAVVVWLDAHADLNVPGASPTDYLGGMAVSGPLGWWDSGFGAGLTPDRLVLVGTRSIDGPEQRAIEEHGIPVVPPGEVTGARVGELVAGRPVVFHLDCDVLEPGLFRTDYREPAGLGLEQLADVTAELAAAGPVVGVEIAEWEGPGTHDATDLVAALRPLLAP
ncbi:arginase family protein [Nocardioides ferulae]|uniref:arginase family protein n=1 Tax=Nocardioides ferulae TaxID=2340821 RepID=UPI000EB275B2|nr:arginase family protein [Nocardioides ferulae]